MVGIQLYFHLAPEAANEAVNNLSRWAGKKTALEERKGNTVGQVSVALSLLSEHQLAISMTAHKGYLEMTSTLRLL